MKRSTLLITIAAVLVAAALLASEAAAADQVNWYDYREATTLGKEQEKKVFLYFRSDNCPYCLKMEKETLGAPDVARFLNRHFVSARIDTDKNRSLSAEFRVVGLPTSYFMDHTGGRIGGLPGFQPSDRFLAFLRFLQSDSYRQMSFGDFLRKQPARQRGG
jgi:thioredoxin-related protein